MTRLIHVHVSTCSYAPKFEQSGVHIGFGLCVRLVKKIKLHMYMYGFESSYVMDFSLKIADFYFFYLVRSIFPFELCPIIGSEGYFVIQLMRESNSPSTNLKKKKSLPTNPNFWGTCNRKQTLFSSPEP